MAIVKNVIVKKSATIEFQFRAENAGYVGVVFKYVDSNNYYTFEIGGGDDITKRFFQIRKKIDNSFSVIKRFNSNEEISSLPFFGYDLRSWYDISIELIDDNISVFASLLGTTAKMQVMKVQDSSIPTGRVGFLSNGTKVVFAEIFIRPIPVAYST